MSPRKNQDKFPGWEEFDKGWNQEVVILSALLVGLIVAIAYFGIYYTEATTAIMSIFIVLTIVSVTLYSMVKSMVVSDRNRTRRHYNRKAK